MSHCTAPEELKHIMLLVFITRLSEWDVMEGTFVGYRCLPSDLLLWEEAGISMGY